MTENYEFSKFLARERYGSQLNACERYRRLHETNEVRHRVTAKKQMSSLANKANVMLHQMMNHSQYPEDVGGGKKNQIH